MQSNPSRRWDPLVRLTHWGVAAGIVANGVFTQEGSDLHQWIGYGVGALVLLRLLWGLVGSPEARFSAFPPSPGKAVAHVRQIIRGEKTPHRSHNPLGALMVYALWATLAVVIGSGIAMTGIPRVSTSPPEAASNARSTGPAAEADEEAREADESGGEEGEAEGGENEGDEVIEEVHEVAANLLFILAAVHVLGVVFETRRSGLGILMSMMPGGARRRRRE